METQNNYVPNHPLEVEAIDEDYYQDDFKSLSDKARGGFIIKVYGILCAQLCLTAGTVVASLYAEPFKLFLAQNTWLNIVCCVVAIVSLYALACYPAVSRKVPINYIVLFIFTSCESIMVAFITVYFDPKTVAAAAI